MKTFKALENKKLIDRLLKFLVNEHVEFSFIPCINQDI